MNNKVTFYISTPFDKLKEKDIIKFRKNIDKLMNNVQEVIYYISTEDQNLQVENAQFENIFQESQSAIAKIADSRTISNCRDIIEEFKSQFSKFSDYFKKIQNELFDNVKNSISHEFLDEDEIEIDIDNSEKKWKEVFASLKKKHKNITDQEINKVDVCYSISIIYEVIDDFTSFYEKFPKSASMQDIINYYENKTSEYEATIAELKKKLSEKDEQLDASKKEQQEIQNELMQCKKQCELLSRQVTDLQNRLRNFSAKYAEKEKECADLLHQISELQSQLKEALENPTPKFDQNELQRIKERYISVLSHVRDLTLVID